MWQWFKSKYRAFCDRIPLAQIGMLAGMCFAFAGQAFILWYAWPGVILLFIGTFLVVVIWIDE